MITNISYNRGKKMIIEEEKVEIMDDNTTENTTTSTFKPAQDTSLKSSKHWIMVVCIFLVIFLCFLAIIFGIFTFYNYQNNQTISKGIYINGIDVSNLTKEEAKNKLTTYYSEKLSNDITLIHNDYTTYIKASEINLSFDVEAAVNYAYQFGKSSNIFADNYQIFNAMINGIDIMPTASFDEESLKNILNNLSSELPDAVVESGYYIDGNTLIITKGKDGYIIDVDSTIEKIRQKISDLSYFHEVIEIDTIAQSPKEIDLDAIYNEVHKDAKDAYYTTDPHVVYPSENGIDFDISLDEAKELLQTADTECEIPLKVLYPTVTTNMIGQEAFPDYMSRGKDIDPQFCAVAAGKISDFIL